MENHPFYPPGQARARGDSCHRPLPPLPNKPFLRVTRQYCRDASFILIRPNDVAVRVKVTTPLDVCFTNFAQSVEAKVEEGPSNLSGRLVYLNFFDSLYLNPDDLEFAKAEKIILVADPPSRSEPTASTETDDLTTLAGSVEDLRKVPPESKKDTWNPPFWTKEALKKFGGADKMIRPFPTGHPAVKTRGQQAEDSFNRAVHAYSKLKDMQGKTIDRYLGHFRVSFPERELEEDRVVNVLMLEPISSRPLSSFKSSSFSTSERIDIREKVLNIAKEIYARDLYYHYIDPIVIQIVKHDHSVRFNQLHFMHDRNEIEEIEGPVERERRVKRHISRLKDALDELGYKMI